MVLKLKQAGPPWDKQPRIVTIAQEKAACFTRNEAADMLRPVRNNWHAKMKSKQWAILGAALLASTAALAAPGSGGSAAVTDNKYGAIAFNKASRKHGYAFNQSSRAAAEARALAECGKDCTPMMWFANGCGALAVGSTRYGAGSADSRLTAELLARRNCGQSDCRIVVYSCTDRPKT
ncbi:MAG: DUF4189 domain-containing protein [Haliea sp.]|nr:MAG: DUF4189 domain-containing protein [Haliea sp.]